MGFLDLLTNIGLQAGVKKGKEVATKILPPIEEVVKKVIRPELVSKMQVERERQLITPPDIMQYQYKPTEVFTPELQSTFRGLGSVATMGALPLYDVAKGIGVNLLQGKPTSNLEALKYGITGKTPRFADIAGFRKLAPEAVKFALTTTPVTKYIPPDIFSDEALTNLAELGIDLAGIYGVMKLPALGAKVAKLAPNIIKQKIIEKIPDKVFRLDYPTLQNITSGQDTAKAEIFRDIEQATGKKITDFTKIMRKKGYVDITIPGKDIVNFVDRPWWSTIKEGFKKSGLASSAGYAYIPGKGKPKGFRKLTPKDLKGEIADYNTIPGTIQAEAQSHTERAMSLDVVKKYFPNLKLTQDQINKLNLDPKEWGAKWQKATDDFLSQHKDLTPEQQLDITHSAFLGLDETGFEGGGKLAKELHDKYLIPASEEYIKSKMKGEMGQKEGGVVTPKTFTGRIKQGGGIDFSKDYNVKEMKEFGLKNTPGARAPDDWALSLMNEGLIQVPENMNPGDYLIELLKTKAGRNIAVSSEATISREYGKYLKTKGAEAGLTDKELDFDVEKLEAQQVRDLVAKMNERLKAVGKPSVLKPSEVKGVIEKTTGIKTLVDTITMREDVALRQQLRTEKKATEAGYMVGKEEIRGLERIKKETEEIAIKLSNLAKRDLPPEYKNQIADELNSLGLLEGERPLRARKKLAEFVAEQQAKGELMFISEGEIALADYVELGNATKDLLQQKYDVLKQIAEIGSREKKLIAFGEEAALDEIVDTIRDSIRKNISVKMAKPSKGLTPSARKQKFIARINNSVSAFFSHLRKVEFISRTLDGFTEGPAQKEIITKINKASDKELLDNEQDMSQIKELLKSKEFNVEQMIKKTITVNYNDKVKILTKMEMMGIYLNNLNEGNRFRLTNPEGWGLTEENITNAIARLTPKEKEFANLMQKIASSRRDEMNSVKVALIGKEMGKVEGYWPIVPDKELNAQAKLKEGEADLFQDVINKTFVARGPTYTREGGNAPVELDAFKVFLNHVAKVNHFTSHALAVRDIQKIIGSDKFRSAVTDALGENIYKQFQPWLKDIANPKQYSLDMSERWITRLRNNATSAILGMKISVSLLQVGSYTQTINELGLAAARRGLFGFYHHPIGIAKKINELSTQMKFRGSSWDRDLKAFADSAAGKELIKGSEKRRDALFALIQTMDRAATYPTWWSAYLKKMKETHGNVKASTQFADGVVRRTQPSGMTKDLSAIMKGSAFKKLWTMFYTHFSNYHNQMALEFDRLKLGKKFPLRRFYDFVVAHLWLTVIPGIYAVHARRGFKKGVTKEEIIKGIVSYALGSIPIVRDIANGIIRRRPDPLTTPGLSGVQKLSQYLTEVTKPLFGKEAKPEKIREYGFKTLGYATGMPTEQAWTTMSGLMDLMSGKTKDLRRLGFSKYALGTTKEKPKGFLKFAP